MSAPSPETDRTTILVVDDDLPFVGAVAELLTDRGFRVVGHATSAHDAMLECRRLTPDGVLLDVRLGDDNGVMLVSSLRDTPRPPRVLLTSSDSTAVPPEQVRLSGASGFVPKSELARSDLDRFFTA